LVLEALRQGVNRLGTYPATVGTLELRSSAARWLERRFTLRSGSVDPATMVLPVNGTREALFALVQAAVDTSQAPLVITPNPFYQIYEGAALLAGATPYYLNATAKTNFAPDLDSIPKAVLDRTQVLFLCSPGNPTGAVLHENYLAHALDLAERHDFIIASDECYAEIYPDEAAPPPSLLEVAQDTGRDRFQRCIVFHSLSKRSSVPGLRSGFVAGDPELMRKFLLYRTYQGGAMSPMVQMASCVAWDDDAHVRVNRQLYREKFDRVLPILSPVLDVQRPAGAFYLWVDIDGDDERFTRELFGSQNVSVLPGSYLGRATEQGNPGAGRVRLSLTATVEDCVTAATRIRDFIKAR
jgi:N-succinyldiaminopimelate aminotransferase